MSALDKTIYIPKFITDTYSHIDIQYQGLNEKKNNYKSVLLKIKQNHNEGRHGSFAIKPLPSSEICSYFQTQIIINSQSSPQMDKQGNQQKLLEGLSFGLIPCINNYRRDYYKPGLIPNSFGVIGATDIYKGNIKMDDLLWNLKRGDTVGIGILHHNNKIFLTLNGQLLPDRFRLEGQKILIRKQYPITFKVEEWYPAVCLSQKHQQVKLTFLNNKQGLKFDYDAHYQKVANKLRHKIMNQSQVKQAQIYKLVRDYCWVNGYQKTCMKLQAQMRAKKMKYQGKQAIKNPDTYNQLTGKYLQEKYRGIKAQQKQKKQRYCPSYHKKKTRKRNIFGYHCSSDSDNNSDDSGSLTPDQAQRQYTLEQYLSNKQIQQKVKARRAKQIQQPQQTQIRLKKQKEQRLKRIDQHREKKYDKIKSQMLRSREIHARDQRGNLLRTIKQGNLQLAEKMILHSFSKEYHLHQKYLPTYFRVNIFFKKIKTEGKLKAIQYLEQQIPQIQQYQNNLFPFYAQSTNLQQQSYVMKPLNQILVILAQNRSQQFDFGKQLQAFSDFIGMLMSRNAGYLENTRLELAIEHYRLVMKNCKIVGIPGTQLSGKNLV